MASLKDMNSASSVKKSVAKIFIDQVMQSISNDTHAFLNVYEMGIESVRILNEIKAVDLHRVIDLASIYTEDTLAIDLDSL